MVLTRCSGSRETELADSTACLQREFGHDPHRFVALIAAMSERDWLDEIAVYIVDASTIAAAKHWCVRWATLFSVPIVFFWILTVLVLFCAGQTANA